VIDGGYGSIEQVQVMLRADESIPPAADLDSRIDALNRAISLVIDRETGRTFGEAGTAVAELYWIGPYDTLVLNRPVTAITKITYGGTVSGSTMTGGTDILAANLVNLIRDQYGRIYAIAATGNFAWAWNYGWNPYAAETRSPVLVTATIDDTTDPVPDDITYITNYMIAERIKVEKAGPAGFTGPAGDLVPIRDVFNDPLVKRVLKKYGVSNKALVV